MLGAGEENGFFFRYSSDTIGSSVVDVKADKPNDMSMTKPGAERTNPTGQWPGSNRSIRELLLFIY